MQDFTEKGGLTREEAGLGAGGEGSVGGLVLGDLPGGVGGRLATQLALEVREPLGPEDVAGVELALLPGVLDALLALGGVEAIAQAFPDGLGCFRPIVVAETEVRQPEGLGKHPAVAVVLGAERTVAHRGVHAGLGVHVPGR